ncbi:hypothetical protein NPIL_344521, partial [Nephila pilipes]
AFAPKERKIKNSKPLTHAEIANLLAELSNKYPNNFSHDSESDEEFVPPTEAHDILDFNERRTNHARGDMSAE